MIAVNNDSLNSLRFDSIDMVIAAAGYEPRCTHILSHLPRRFGVTPADVGTKLFLLRFKRHADQPTRIAADKTFLSFNPQTALDVDDQDAPAVLATARDRLTAGGRRSPHVLVDYSAMSRGLYLCLIQLLRDGATLTFAYSVGRYGSLRKKYPVASLGSTIRSVSGLDGSAYASRPRFYMFGLGYDGVGTRALADRLEAERYGVFWADPGASPDAPSIAVRANTDLIAGATLRFWRPLDDVQGVFSALRLIADECAHTHKVVFCPVGPKPHILASGLASYSDDHTTLLAPHAPSGGFDKEELPLIAAEGPVVFTRVSWRTQTER